MFRRLFWLGALAGVGYVVWRWVRQQNEAPTAPAGYTYTPPPAAEARPAAPATLGAAASEPASGPRRIPTRVHRGSPPSAPLRSDAPAAEPPPAAPEAGADLAELVGAAAEADLADLASHTAEADPAELLGAAAEADLAELVGAAVAGDEGTDLAPLAGLTAEADAPLTNINSADEEALIALPGIGPALARRIIAYRTEHGPFATIDQLEAIQGIGPRNIDDFRHLVTV